MFYFARWRYITSVPLSFSSLPPSLSLARSLGRWEPSLYNLMSLIRLYRAGWMDGVMDGQMEGGMIGWKNEKNALFSTPTPPHPPQLSSSNSSLNKPHTCSEWWCWREIRLKLIAIMTSAVTSLQSWCSFNYQSKLWLRCTSQNACFTTFPLCIREINSIL